MARSALDPLVADPNEQADLAALADRLSQASNACPTVEFAGENGGPPDRLPLPKSAATLLAEVAKRLQRGETVSVVTIEKDMTTQEAADYLGMSRQHLVNLLEQGVLPFHLVGTHRRINREDVMEYRARRDGIERKALAEITAIGEPYYLIDASAKYDALRAKE